MSFLSQARQGAAKKPKLFLIYGGNDCWKTSELAKMPNVFILAIEDNNDHIEDGTISDTAKDYETVMATLDELATVDHPFHNLGIDSLTALDVLIREKALRDNRVKTLKDIPYGGGKQVVTDLWHNFYVKVKKVMDRGLNVGCLAQQMKWTEPQPDGKEVDKFMPNISDAGLQIFKDNAKGIFYVKKDLYLKKEEGGFGKESYRAQGSGGVILFTQGEHFLVKIAKSKSQEIPVSMDFNLNYLMDMWINPENYQSQPAQ